ncbi:MAG: flagellar biosynthetic protein FliQ [Labilithrix sp.]|nr:flagellar biosynthetic protein FliQ [Labilithrix sp.]MCW5817162.1 flagellar biosynthetic protein FliQ [Labilithrix sp.]
MSSDQALATILGLFQTVMWVAGPVLAITLVAGLLVGVAQTVLQINEQSVAFVVKVIAVVGVLVLLGPVLANKLIDYTTRSLGSIESVVH